ncbi:hypothetical protein JAB5_27690 [Janthinobacterium sp. HH103]|nr:hypothetical protein JAB2_50890 [Janthinobacterium sp. HH100]OEZ76460.1 hypothetical protein JAB5_27690 [Janthinobacterium sp. HH103]QOU76172.1 hypothetical protein JAB4_056720 [Janthinobacterium sp. HH102]
MVNWSHFDQMTVCITDEIAVRQSIAAVFALGPAALLLSKEGGNFLCYRPLFDQDHSSRHFFFFPSIVAYDGYGTRRNAELKAHYFSYTNELC